MQRTLKYLPLGLLLAGVSVLAQPKLTASVDAKQVLVQESFTWTLEVEGSDEMPQLRLPEIEKLALVSGPMQSSNYSYVNGKMSAKKSLSYTFLALEPGKVIIPGMEVILGRSRYRTNPVTVEVLASQNAASKTAGTGQSVYLQAIPSKRNIFLGEPLTVQYKLFTKVGVYNYQVDKLPDAVGFWAEEVPQANQPRLVSELVDGERYNTAVLKTVLYYPTRSGDLLIDPLSTDLEIEVQSSQKRRRVFNDPFFSDPFFNGTQRANRTFSSNPVKIQVKPLPEPKPRDFSGAVGKFQIKASLDTNAVFANDAVGLTILLEGSGNFKSIQVPEPKLPAEVDVFKPEREEKISISGMKHTGSKRATYLLVPRKAGDLVIDPIEFSYYDLNANKYITKSTGWIKLKVYDASGSQPVVTSGYSREEVALMQDDIRYIKAAQTPMLDTSRGIFGFGFWVFHGVGLAFILGVFAYQFQHDRLEGNLELRRSAKAMATAKIQLKQARKLPEDSPALRSQLHKIILGYIGARLNLAENAISSETLLEALNRKQVDATLVADTAAVLEGLTLDRFAPGAVQRSDSEWIDLIGKLLQRLGRAL